MKALRMRQDKAKSYYDPTGRDISPLEGGDMVRIHPNGENHWRKAELLPRSYVVQDDRGRLYRRNRRQIISVPEDQPMIPQTKPPMISTVPDEPNATLDFTMTTRSGRVIKNLRDSSNLVRGDFVNIVSLCCVV